MARYLYKSLALSEFSPVQPYCFRHRLDDEALLAAVRRVGILQPLLVTKQKEIIAGHKRYAAAKQLGFKELEVLELTEVLTPQEVFILAVFSNLNQIKTDLDKALIVHRAVHEFKLAESEVREVIFPAIGEDLEKGFYEESLEVMSLTPGILEGIAAHKIPFRGARILRRFLPEDQKTFAEIAQTAAFTTNQLLKSVEWLYDLLKLSGNVSLQVFLKQNRFDEILRSEQDRKSKGEHFFAKVRLLRYPQVARREKEFADLSRQLRDPKCDFLVELPPFSEAEGFTLKAKLTDPQSLERVIEAIQSKRKVLNSLLDLVL